MALTTHWRSSTACCFRAAADPAVEDVGGDSLDGIDDSDVAKVAAEGGFVDEIVEDAVVEGCEAKRSIVNVPDVAGGVVSLWLL